MPGEAHTAAVHLVTPGGHSGGDSRPLLRIELDAWVTVGKEHELHGDLLRLSCFNRFDCTSGCDSSGMGSKNVAWASVLE
jgi:hypothetical protein